MGQLSVADLLVSIRGEAGSALAALSATDQAVRRTAAGSAGALRSIEVGIGAMGLAADVAIAGSVKAATGFQSMLATIQANTTLTAGETQKLGETIRGMARESGASLQQLGRGLEHISNFGFQGADAVGILDAAMKSAVSTGSDVGVTANMLAAAMKEFALNGSDAGHAMDVLHLAAAQGNMRLEELVESGGRAISTAANLGDSFTDVAAALSALTRHGFDASTAATQVTGMLTHIVNPAHAARVELAHLSKTTGVDLVHDFSQAGLQTKGLHGIFQDLHKALGNNTGELLKLIPALRGGQGALALLGVGAQDFDEILQSLDETMAGKTNPTLTAYEARQKTVGQELARLKANLHDVAISIGAVFLPALSAVLEPLARAAQAVSSWASAHPQLAASIVSVVAAFGTLIGGAAAFGFIASAMAPVLGGLAAMLTTLAAPIATLIGVSALLVVAWQGDWLHIREAVAGAWSAVRPIFEALSGAIGRVSDAFRKDGLLAAFREVPSALRPVGEAFLHLGADIAQSVLHIDWGNLARSIGDGILGGLRAVGGLGQRLGSWIAGEVAGIDWGRIWAGIKGAPGQTGSAILSVLKGAGNLAQELGQWVTEQVQKVDWGGIWAGIKAAPGAVGGAAAGAGSAILNLLKGAGTLAQELTGWLREQLGAIDWAGLGQSVQSGGQSAGTAILTVLKGAGDLSVKLGDWLAGEVGKIDWAQVWAAVSQGAQTLVTSLQAIDISGPMDRIREAVKGAGDAIDTHLTSKNAVVSAAFSAIGDAATTFIKPLGALFGTLGRTMDDATKAGGLLHAAFTDIASAAQSLAQAGAPLADIFRTLGSAIATVAVPAAKAIAAVITGTVIVAFQVLNTVVLGPLVGAMQGALPGALKVAEAALRALTIPIKTVAEVFLDMVRVVDDLIHGRWHQAWEDAKLAVKAAIDGLVAWIRNGVSLVQAAIQTVIGAIRGAFAGAAKWLFNAGADIVGGLISGIMSKLDDLKGALGHVTSLIPIHKGPPEVDKLLLFGSGQFVMEGLIGGILSKGDALIGVLQQTGRALKSGFERELEIASMSQWGIRTGEFTGAGLEEGLRRRRPHVRHEAQRLGEEAAAGVRAAAPKVHDAVLTLAEALATFPAGTKLGNEAIKELLDAIRAGNQAAHANAQDLRQLAELQTGHLRSEHEHRTADEMAATRAQAEDQRQTAMALLGFSQQMNQKVLDDITALNSAIGEDARRAALAQLKEDEAVAQGARTAASDAYQAWKDSQRQIVDDERQAMRERLRIQREYIEGLRGLRAAERDMAEAGRAVDRAIANQAERDIHTVTQATLTGDQQRLHSAQAAAVSTARAWQGAAAQVVALQGQLNAAVAAGNEDLAGSLREQLAGAQLLAQNAKDAAEGAAQTQREALSSVKFDEEALQKQREEARKFDLTRELDSINRKIAGIQHLTNAEKAAVRERVAALSAPIAAAAAEYQRLVSDAQQHAARLVQIEEWRKNQTNPILRAILDAEIQMEQARIDADSTATKAVLDNLEKLKEAFRDQADMAVADAERIARAQQHAGGHGGHGAHGVAMGGSEGLSLVPPGTDPRTAEMVKQHFDEQVNTIKAEIAMLQARGLRPDAYLSLNGGTFLDALMQKNVDDMTMQALAQAQQVRERRAGFDALIIGQHLGGSSEQMSRLEQLYREARFGPQSGGEHDLAEVRLKELIEQLKQSHADETRGAEHRHREQMAALTAGKTVKLTVDSHDLRGWIETALGQWLDAQSMAAAG